MVSWLGVVWSNAQNLEQLRIRAYAIWSLSSSDGWILCLISISTTLFPAAAHDQVECQVFPPMLACWGSSLSVTSYLTRGRLWASHCLSVPSPPCLSVSLWRQRLSLLVGTGHAVVLCSCWVLGCCPNITHLLVLFWLWWLAIWAEAFPSTSQAVKCIPIPVGQKLLSAQAQNKTCALSCLWTSWQNSSCT